MASCKNPDSKRKQKDSLISNLRDLFGDVLHIDIIRSVATQCNFDAQRSSNILLEMSSNIDQPSPKKKEKNKRKAPQQTPKNSEPSTIRLQPSPSTGNLVKSKKSLELDRVIDNIRQGYKVLIILRGLPGSGKSRLAVAITDVTLGPGNNSHHILSTDDFFVQQRGYVFDPAKLAEAHGWNHSRAFRVMSRGLSPVIIDNTSTQMWEMKPYAMMATDYGYIIEILEPDTWWCFNDKELAKRNVHNVSKVRIKEMLDRYDKNVTSQKLLSVYNLRYKFQKPPQFRLLPPISQNGYPPFGYHHPPAYPTPMHQQNGSAVRPAEGVVKSKSTSALNHQLSTEPFIETINLMDFNDDVAIEETDTAQGGDRIFSIVDPIDEILMYTEETSSNVLQPHQVGEDDFSAKDGNSKNFRDMENAWGVDEKALQSWDIVTPLRCDVGTARPHSEVDQEQEFIKPETRDISSSFETSDFLKEDGSAFPGYRVIEAQSRDINFGSTGRITTIRKKIMVDKSSLTEDPEDALNESDENRIKDLMDLFPKFPESAVRELFYKCNKNFHWTVDLLLDDNNLEVVEPKEDGHVVAEESIQIDDSCDEVWEQSKDVKVFKHKNVSDNALELKKCLEGKFDFNKEHYSEHVHRVKQSKFGAYQDSQPCTSTPTECGMWGYQEPLPCTSAAMEFDEDDASSSCSDDDPKNLVEFNLGQTFVDQLETIFGSGDGIFPKGFQPVVQMPISLARQIYSIYVGSICQQMEAQTHILDRLVKEDEEFARKLQEEEVPPKPPNLAEIMDEQVAMNLHRKDAEQWKNMTADNLAALLTRQKLFSTFPNLDQNALLEILHAYGYDYNKAIEDLIASVGPENVNGGREAIKEPPLSKSTLEEMRNAEESCGDFEEPEEQQPATFYREEANKHLRKREQLHETAKTYYQKGMTEVARFYSELAQKETKSYDRANHIAAAAFIEEHSKRLQKFDTLDLHYFYVKEAIPNLDIFIDRNINLLKGGTKQGQDLYVITGRGKNSEGGRCRIKPAVISRLKKRRIGFVQVNPGLLKIRVMKNSLITSDLP